MKFILLFAEFEKVFVKGVDKITNTEKQYTDNIINS